MALTKFWGSNQNISIPIYISTDLNYNLKYIDSNYWIFKDSELSIRNIIKSLFSVSVSIGNVNGQILEKNEWQFDSTRSTRKYQELLEIPGSTRKYPEVPGNIQIRKYPEVTEVPKTPGSTRKCPEAPGSTRNSLDVPWKNVPQYFLEGFSQVPGNSWKYIFVKTGVLMIWWD